MVDAEESVVCHVFRLRNLLFLTEISDGSIYLGGA